MVDHNVPDKQRALILQGGGALGAYEVGAFKALIKKIPEIDERTKKPVDRYLILLLELR